MAREPLEVLKSGTKQVLGTPEMAARSEPQAQAASSESNLAEHKEREQKVKQKDASMLSALENEVKEIGKQKLIKELQERIQRGEEVPLVDFPELTDNERQMLSAQINSVKAQTQMQNQSSGVPLPSSKPSRRFGMGKGPKAAAEKQQTRVEKPIPPSG